MKFFELTIPDHLTQRRGDVHREVLDDQTIVMRLTWNVLKDRLDVSLFALDGEKLLQGEPVHLWRNLASSADKLPGWQLVASRADGKRTYTREEIPQLTLRIGIPETTAEINDAPLLTVGV
ncbi:MAG: hypothetical protein ABEL51_05720 [Salinibacter sp.]